MEEHSSENVLTDTDGFSTISTDVDATTKKIMKQIQELEQQKLSIGIRLDSLKRTLEMVGIKPTATRMQEGDYARLRPFKSCSLKEACSTVLRDAKGESLTMAQIEYLVVRGGYEFTTSDTKNSVAGTLQRLAADGLIRAERMRGVKGNKYSALTMENKANDVTNPRATS